MKATNFNFLSLRWYGKPASINVDKRKQKLKKTLTILEFSKSKIFNRKI